MAETVAVSSRVLDTGLVEPSKSLTHASKIANEKIESFVLFKIQKDEWKENDCPVQIEIKRGISCFGKYFRRQKDKKQFWSSFFASKIRSLNLKSSHIRNMKQWNYPARWELSDCQILCPKNNEKLNEKLTSSYRIHIFENPNKHGAIFVAKVNLVPFENHRQLDLFLFQIDVNIAVVFYKTLSRHFELFLDAIFGEALDRRARFRAANKSKVNFGLSSWQSKF